MSTRILRGDAAQRLVRTTFGEQPELQQRILTALRRRHDVVVQMDTMDVWISDGPATGMLRLTGL